MGEQDDHPGGDRIDAERHEGALPASRHQDADHQQHEGNAILHAGEQDPERSRRGDEHCSDQSRRDAEVEPHVVR